MNKKTSVAAALAVVIGIGIGPAQAELAAKGLPHPVNGFPTWFSDSRGMTLQMCLDGNGIDGPCFYDEVIPGNTFSELTGFGPEAFWWSGEATLDLGDGNGAIVVLALEAAYGSGDPAPGDQLAFGRVRLRIDIPVAGQYKVWHPYLDELTGCAPEVYDSAAGTRAINVTRDIGSGAPFDTMLTGEVGPFLVWDATLPVAPTGYVGDPTVEHAVEGGHCGINYFKIEGPAGSNLGGPGIDFVETNLFSVQGKIFDADNTLPAIAPVRATYLRSTGATSGFESTRLNIWVQAPPGATVAVTGLPQGNGPMVDPDGNGVFFRRSGLNNPNSQTLPPQITISATNAAGTTLRDVTLSDSVDITRASWSNGGDSLSITATSSDRIRDALLRPVLTTVVNGTSIELTPSITSPGRYTANVTGLLTPPAFITVTSTAGGSDTQKVAD